MFDAEALAALANVSGGVSGSLIASELRDWIYERFGGNSSISRSELESALQEFLHVKGANIEAGTLINMWANRGLLVVEGSTLYAPNSVTLGADKDGTFTFGDGSESRTAKTGIAAGKGAQITGSNAVIRQNEDGSISFHVGNRDKE